MWHCRHRPQLQSFGRLGGRPTQPHYELTTPYPTTVDRDFIKKKITSLQPELYDWSLFNPYTIRGFYSACIWTMNQSFLVRRTTELVEEDKLNNVPFLSFPSYAEPGWSVLQFSFPGKEQTLINRLLPIATGLA
jgi:hypothetical protein